MLNYQHYGEQLRFIQPRQKSPPRSYKSIAAGRLKGMSDINPMWRIKGLPKNLECVVSDGNMKSSECGTKWWQWSNIQFRSHKPICKMNGEWSEAIQGIGGSSL